MVSEDHVNKSRLTYNLATVSSSFSTNPYKQCHDSIQCGYPLELASGICFSRNIIALMVFSIDFRKNKAHK